MVLSRLKPAEYDRLSFLASHKWQEWNAASFVDISADEGLQCKIYWIVPDKDDWGIGRVFDSRIRSTALTSLSDCLENYHLAEFSAKTGKSSQKGLPSLTVNINPLSAHAELCVVIARPAKFSRDQNW